MNGPNASGTRHSGEDRGDCHLIFGATGGIGSALSRRLSIGGHRVFLSGRDGSKVAALAEEIGAPFLTADARIPEQVAACVKEAARSLGRLDGVANCVGSLLLKPAHITTEEEWSETLATNLTSAFAVARSAARAMMDSGGSIVLVSSAAARTGLANHEAIAAAKAGVIGLTLSAAATYAPRGIRVNCVAPGLVRTPLTRRLTDSPASLAASSALHALGRIGEPEDVASAIAWLLSPEQSWVTGQILGIDGGLSSVRPRA